MMRSLSHDLATTALWLQVFFLVCNLFTIVLATIHSDGSCSIATFAPFTSSGKEFPYVGTVRNNLGFSHLAGALLAIEHFNARDASIVPDLNSALYQDCSVQFNINASHFLDSGSDARQSLTRLQDIILTDGPPCGIAGPYNDVPALALSTLATSVEVPIVIHRSKNVDLSNEEEHPFVTQIYPSFVGANAALLSFLEARDRMNYVAILSSLDDTSIQLTTALQVALTTVGARTTSISFVSPDLVLPETHGAIVDRKPLKTALEELKRTDFRTIIVLSDQNKMYEALPMLANEANAHNLLDGDYLWIFLGSLELGYVNDPSIRGNALVRKLLGGAALLMPIEPFFFNQAKNDTFLASWKQQSLDFLSRVKASNPIQKGLPGYYDAPDNYFSSVNPEAGTGYLYDSIMSLGMGACIAHKNGAKNNASLTDGMIPGEQHLLAIQSLDFWGASGRVQLHRTDSIQGTRKPAYASYGTFNLLPPNDEDGVGYILTEVFHPNGPDWSFANLLEPRTVYQEFVYASGRTVPPKDYIPEQNYLSPSFQAFGLSMFSIATAAIVASFTWIVINRKHPVLVAAQPEFLLLICVGSMLTNMAILMSSFDESYGWSEKRLNHACVAIPWFAFLGYVSTYAALFSKLWRVNKILQFVRRKVSISQVIWPLRAILFGTVLVLAIWTVVAPFQWDRDVVDETTGESIGRCSGEKVSSWWLPMAAIVLFVTVLTFFMAWKTKDVDGTYAEASWVFMLILVQMQTLLFCIPLIVILKDLSTSGRYVGNILMIWTFSMSNICLIVLPKVFALYFQDATNSRRPRGTTGGIVEISGLSSDANSMRL